LRTSYFSTILETTREFGAELKAAITQTGDVIWSMHKKNVKLQINSGNGLRPVSNSSVELEVGCPG